MVSSQWRLAVCLVLGATFSSVAHANARLAGALVSEAAEVLDVSGYEALLSQYATEVPRISQEPAEILKLRRSIPSEWSVRVGDARISVATEWLTTDLEKLAANPGNAKSISREIELRLAAMQGEAAKLEREPIEISATVARDRLDKIFQKREFRGLSGPSQWQIFMNRMGRRIGEWILDQLRYLHISGPIGNIFGWSIIALAFIALSYWVGRYLLRLSKGSELKLEGQFVPSNSRAWVKEALAAAERGDYREAVHCAYWAAVVRLEDIQVLTKDRARTPRESLRLLTSRPGEQKLLAELTRHFELIWYGFRPASEADWSSAKAQLEKMGCLSPSTPATASS